MQITVDAEGDDAAAHDLYYWLRQDRELRRHAKADLTQTSEASGRMDAGETINVFVSNGLAAASLLVNIVVAWRAARPSPCWTPCTKQQVRRQTHWLCTSPATACGRRTTLCISKEL